MNDLITDVKVLHEETLNNLKNSKANNTIRAYRSDFKDFGTFCVNSGLKVPSVRTKSSIFIPHTIVN